MVKMVGSGSFTTWYSKEVKIYVDILYVDIVDICNLVDIDHYEGLNRSKWRVSFIVFN